MEIWIVLVIMLGHFIADFICQSEEMATKKSKDNMWLTYHSGVYATVTTFWMMLLVMIIHGFILETSPPSTFVLFPFWCMVFGWHWVTDFLSSKLTSKLWKKKDYHNFFVVIGFDQWLHLVQLLIIYKVLLDGTV